MSCAFMTVPRIAPSASAAASVTYSGRTPSVTGPRPRSAAGAVPAVVTQAQDIGTYWLVTGRVGAVNGDDGALVRARLSSHGPVPKAGEAVWLRIVGPRSCFYGADQKRVEGAAA